MRTTLFALTAAVLLLGACGADSEPDGSQPKPEAEQTTPAEPEEVRLDVLPETDLGEEGPLSFMDHTEIIKCWEGGGDVLRRSTLTKARQRPSE